MKIVGELSISFIPKSKSDKKNKATASQNIGKYTIPKSANKIDIQNGIKSIENKSMKKNKIRIIIILILHALVENTNYLILEN